MAPPTMDIRMIKDVLRLKLHGVRSHEAIARSLSVSKGVVAKYVALASAAGLNRWARPSWSGACSAPRPSSAAWPSPTSPACTSSCAARA